MSDSRLDSGVAVVGFGAATAVGRTALSAVAAARAGITGFIRHPTLLDRVEEPYQVAAAPWLDPALKTRGRFEALLLPVIEEAMKMAPATLSKARPSLRLALPGHRPGVSDDLFAHLTSAVAREFPSVFDSIQPFAFGHAAGLIALAAAMAELAAFPDRVAVVASVDSWLDPTALRWLEANEQIHGAGFLNNAWGFVPGEGAAAVALAGAGAAGDRAGMALGRVLCVGLAREANCIKTETVCVGDGLGEAMREALSQLAPGSEVSDVYCDQNGEPYRADEFAFAILRSDGHFRSAADFIASADCWGDVGAAGSILHLIQALVARTKQYANGALAMVWASSESGERACALLDAAPRWTRNASDD